MNITQINQEIMTGNFTNADLDTVHEAVKYARSKLIRQAARTLRIGDQVKFTSNRNGRTYQGELKEIKIKNAIVQTAFGRYRVPMNMLEAA